MARFAGLVVHLQRQKKPSLSWHAQACCWTVWRLGHARAVDDKAAAVALHRKWSHVIYRLAFGPKFFVSRLVARTMERVQYSLERSLPQLKLLDEHGILTKEEIRSVTTQRQGFEARLIRRKAEKADFLRYIEFETDLHTLVLLRVRAHTQRVAECIRAGDESAKARHLPRTLRPKLAASYSAQCVSIFERLVRKLRWDVDSWERYLAWAKSRKMRVVAGRVYARALALHPMHPELWLSAADYELNSNADTTAARALLQRGLRTNKLTDTDAQLAKEVQSASKHRKTERGAHALREPDALRWSLTNYEQSVLRMWVEYMRMELVFLERLRRRWRVLGLDSGSEPTQASSQDLHDAQEAAQSVALDADDGDAEEDEEEEEDIAAAEAAVEADVPTQDDDDGDEASSPASARTKATRPTAGTPIPPGHHQIMSGSIPLVVLANAQRTLPPSVQLYLYVALWQLFCSFPFFDSVLVKSQGDVISLRTSTGTQGSGDQLRARLLQGVLDTWEAASIAWDEAGRLSFHMMQCLHPLWHPMSHGVHSTLAWSDVPASRAEAELESNAYLHGASQLHAKQSPALDALWDMAHVPATLRDDQVVTGAFDPWRVCRVALFLLHVLQSRLVAAPRTDEASEEKEEEEEDASESQASRPFQRDTTDDSIASSSDTTSWHSTPFLTMLTSSGDIPAVIQQVVAAFRSQSHADVPLAFLATLRFLLNPARSGLDESNLRAYLHTVDAKLLSSLQAQEGLQGTWIATMSMSQRLAEQDASVWPDVESCMSSTQGADPCVCLLYERAALRFEMDQAFVFSWAHAHDSLAGERALQAWKPLLSACTSADQFVHDASVPVWGLMILWLGTSSTDEAASVAPAHARRALWLDYLDWVHDAALVRRVWDRESDAMEVTSQERKASKWAWRLYEQAIQQTGRVLAASHLLGSARRHAQALHDAVVRRYYMFSASSSAFPAVAQDGVMEHSGRDKALHYALAQSSASAACWLDLARLESMRLEAQLIQTSEPLRRRVAKLFERALALAERADDLSLSMDTWMAYLKHLVYVQKDMPLALQMLNKATMQMRQMGGEEAVVLLETQWRAVHTSPRS
ncbi:Pwp2-containing subcomplex of 90S preribosome protein [Malassezia pachydermatis]